MTDKIPTVVHYEATNKGVKKLYLVSFFLFTVAAFCAVGGSTAPGLLAFAAASGISVVALCMKWWSHG